MSVTTKAKGRNVIMLVAAVTLGLSGYATAQPSPGYGPGPHHGSGGMMMGPGGLMGPSWHHGPRFGDYYSGQQVPREKVEAAVRDVLARATLGSAWHGCDYRQEITSFRLEAPVGRGRSQRPPIA